MKILINLLTSILLIQILNSQAIVSEFALEKKIDIAGVSKIANETNGNLALFLFSYKDSKVLLFNNKMDSISSMNFKFNPHDYTQRLGGLGDKKDRYIFVFRNPNWKRFSIGTFDFNKSNSKFGKTVIKIEKEIFLNSFKTSDRFHLLTFSKNSSYLNLYNIELDGTYTKEVIDLSNVIFRHWNYKIVPLSKIIQRPFGSTVNQLMTKVNTNYPNSLENTAGSSKMFVLDNKLFLAFESNRNTTQTVTINLENFQFKTNSFQKPSLSNTTQGKKSNSFIFDGKYFGVAGDSRGLKLEIKDVNTKQILKTYEIQKNEVFPFPEASIYFKGTGIKNKSKEVENFKKLIKEISKNEVGISIVKDGKNNVITLGSFFSGTTGFGLGYGGLTTGISALYTYSTTQSTFMKGLFDENYNYLPIEVKPSAYDVLKDFINENKKNKYEIIFKRDSFYIYGSYNKKVETYSFRKFKDIN